MKKNSNLAGMLGIIALIFTTMAFLFPLAPGLQVAATDVGTIDLVRGYDFVFTNNAVPFTIEATDGLVAMFVLFIVGAFFELCGLGLGWYGGKFGGFLSIVGGLCMAVAAALAFMTPIMVSAPQFTISIGWGFIATASAAAISALLALFVGLKAFTAKAN